MTRAVGNWLDRERPVPHGEDDMAKTTMTTDEIRRGLADMRKVAQLSTDQRRGDMAAGEVAVIERHLLPLAEERDALKAERDALRAEVEGLRAWKSATISAAYEVVKMHDDGPECWPAWFEGYGVDGLCAAMYPEAPHG